MDIKVCQGPHCLFRGSEKVYETIKDSPTNITNNVSYCQCLDHCDDGPNVVADNKLYNHAKPATINEQIKQGNGTPIIALTYDDLKLDDLL